MSKLKQNPKNIEIIEWIDSAGFGGWHKPEKDKLSKIISCGWVLSESNNSLTITSHVDFVFNNHYADITIPKVAIVKRYKLNGKRN